MRISKIGSIVLDHAMWVDESFTSSGVEAEAVDNLDGGVIVFEQTVRTSKKNLTLRSRNDAWQKDTTVASLISLADGSLGQTIVIEDDAGATIDVRFRHEVGASAVKFDRIIDAKTFEWYTGTIYLARV